MSTERRQENKQYRGRCRDRRIRSRSGRCRKRQGGSVVPSDSSDSRPQHEQPETPRPNSWQHRSRISGEEGRADSLPWDLQYLACKRHTLSVSPSLPSPLHTTDTADPRVIRLDGLPTIDVLYVPRHASRDELRPVRLPVGIICQIRTSRQEIASIKGTQDVRVLSRCIVSWYRGMTILTDLCLECALFCDEHVFQNSQHIIWTCIDKILKRAFGPQHQPKTATVAHSTTAAVRLHCCWIDIDTILRKHRFAKRRRGARQKCVDFGWLSQNGCSAPIRLLVVDFFFLFVYPRQLLVEMRDRRVLSSPVLHVFSNWRANGGRLKKAATTRERITRGLWTF